jgi:hypothetical protein
MPPNLRGFEKRSKEAAHLLKWGQLLKPFQKCLSNKRMKVRRKNVRKVER